MEMASEVMGRMVEMERNLTKLKNADQKPAFTSPIKKRRPSTPFSTPGSSMDSPSYASTPGSARSISKIIANLSVWNDQRPWTVFFSFASWQFLWFWFHARESNFGNFALFINIWTILFIFITFPFPIIVIRNFKVEVSQPQNSSTRQLENVFLINSTPSKLFFTHQPGI